jgi:glutathione S-transferase
MATTNAKGCTVTRPLVFYTHLHSRGAIVHWMLEETGARYTIELKEYGTSMKAPDYLADTFPEAGLAPEPSPRGDYYRWLFFAAGSVEPAIAPVQKNGGH